MPSFFINIILTPGAHSRALLALSTVMRDHVIDFCVVFVVQNHDDSPNCTARGLQCAPKFVYLTLLYVSMWKFRVARFSQRRIQFSTHSGRRQWRHVVNLQIDRLKFGIFRQVHSILPRIMKQKDSTKEISPLAPSSGHFMELMTSTKFCQVANCYFSLARAFNNHL